MGQTTGQTIGAIGGAAIGFIASGFNPMGAVYGYQIGMTIGAIVDPTVIKNQGPKLGDASVQYSSYGAVSPILFGTYRVAGNVIWMSEPRDIPKKTRTGKGGPVQETTTYQRKVDFAVRITGTEIGDILKIFADGKLLYDLNENSDINAVVQSGEIADTVRIYRGTLDQLPDPLIEAARGVGNTPAYRGRSYIVFEGWDTTSLGGRLPMLSFVVSEPVEGIGAHLIDSGTIESISVPTLTAQGSALTVVPNDVSKPQVLLSLDGTTAAVLPREEVYSGDQFSPTTVTGIHRALQAGTGASWYAESGWAIGDVSTPPSYAVLDGGAWIIGAPIQGFDDLIGTDNLLSVIPDMTGEHAFIAWAPDGADVNATPEQVQFAMVRRTDAGFTVLRQGVAGSSDAAVIASLGAIGNAGDFYCGMVEEDLEHIWVVTTVVARGVCCIRIDDNDELQEVTQIAAGDMTFASFVTCLASKGVCWAVSNETEFHSWTRLSLGVSATANLQDVIERIGAAAGYELGEIDATAAAAEIVDGYAIAVASTARAAIEQLQVIYAFDMVERGDQLVVVMRGGEVEVTIPFNHLGASLEQSDVQDRVTSTRLQEDQLPVEFNFGYALKEFDYQPSTAKDQRQFVASRQIVNLSVPIAMTNDQGQQVATKNLFNAYQSRETRVIRVSATYAAIDPASVIQVEDLNVTYRGRVVATSFDQGILEITFTDDDAAIWTQTKPGEAPPPAQVLAPLPPTTVLALFDLPPLRDEDAADFGFYAAVAGVDDGWTGARLYRSRDGGATFGDDATVDTESAIAITLTALGTAPTGTFDYVNFVDISVISGEFTSCTHAQLLAGANTIAIGSEVLQYRDVVDLGGTKRRLMSFYRGLKGTEFWTRQPAMSTPPAGYRQTKGFYPIDSSGADALGHYPGQYVAELSLDTTYRLSASASDTRVSMIERAVTLGAPVGSGTDTAYRHRGKGRLALPPSNLSGFITGGDAVLSWHRRSRIDGDWRSGGDVPEDFAIERYWVQVNDGPVFTSSTQTLTITDAELTAAGISEVESFRVAQIPDEGTSAIDIYDADPEVWSPELEIS